MRDGGGGAPVPTALWEKGGRGRPSPTGPKAALKPSIPHDLSEGALSPRPLRSQAPGLKEHWGQGLRKGGFGEKFQGAPPPDFLISPTTYYLNTFCMPGNQHPSLLWGFLLFSSSEPPSQQAGHN